MAPVHLITAATGAHQRSTRRELAADATVPKSTMVTSATVGDIVLIDLC